ncbi:helix-turn-helix domain-containing protein [Thalassomonas sp. M1454]|uniref:helix-turn-helix domain-containing protein n=1 Tax=Thalassomonas sp. M1454 TaxID=2594477 RepID=UPI00117E047A|nr:AraC family transcriptional regulator [Thalassomonas sp. M1454]TRX56489.1 helix-turn-helix transcriptional regulator [Thalassomonas sp. M1454]
MDTINTLDQTKKTIRTMLGVEPVASFTLGKKSPFGLERFVCREVKGVVPKFGSLVIGVQFSGANIKTFSSLGIEDKSTTSMISIFPTDVEISFSMLGDVDFALLEIVPDTSALANKLYQMAKSLVAVMLVGDALLDTLIRQLLLLAQENNQDEEYIDSLLYTIMLHTQRLLQKQQTNSFTSNSLQLNRIRSSVEYIHQNLQEQLSVQLLAKKLDVSESYFRKIFTDVMGKTVHQFILQTRLNRARELLIHSALSISQIAQSLGFSSQSHLTTQFAKAYDVTPAQYRRNIR